MFWGVTTLSPASPWNKTARRFPLFWSDPSKKTMLTFRGFRRDARQATLKVSLRMSALTLLLVSLVSAFERPSFTETPAAARAAPGQTATFRCRAVGDPEPEVVWFKNRRERVECVRFRTTEEGDLLISVRITLTTLPMLRLLLFKAQGRKDS